MSLNFVINRAYSSFLISVLGSLKFIDLLIKNRQSLNSVRLSSSLLSNNLKVISLSAEFFPLKIFSRHAGLKLSFSFQRTEQVRMRDYNDLEVKCI